VAYFKVLLQQLPSGTVGNDEDPSSV